MGKNEQLEQNIEKIRKHKISLTSSFFFSSFLVLVFF